MSAILDGTSSGGALAHWLRLLFDRAPALCFDSDAPFIAGGAIHLPPRASGALGRAAAAHAAAHLVYSPAGFDGDGLGPIARALFGLLEDARVEALAMRELPGLARLWRPLHDATPALGASFEALLQRLARALADPRYDDPDAWVRKGRALFFLDADLGVAALRTPAEVRQAAVRLGHDIGQLRLQLNASTYRPAPAYRDDHRWMWAADVAEPVPPPAGHAASDRRDDEALPPEAEARVDLYPEWDRLIERLRPAWCRVVEQPAPRVAHSGHDTAASAAVREPASALADGALREPLRALARTPHGNRRSDEGDCFEPDALVDWRIARRLGIAGDPRVFRGTDRRAGRASAWLLVDGSASSANVLAPGGPSVLQAAARAAEATARALRGIGVECAVAAFASHGRHDVRMTLLKSFDEPADAAFASRLRALRAGGSTRLGAALRHAASRLAGRPPGPRWVLLFSDGEPHDIDIHDRRYLVEDARRAVRAAARQSVRMVCVALEAKRGAEAVRIFGGAGVRSLRQPRELAAVFRRLLG